jgi:FHS family L-fucose permease-like MFS transporter
MIVKKSPLNFFILICIFFAFGFITSLNGLLNPLVRQMFHTSYAGSNLVQFAFFIAYFCGSLIYAVFNKSKIKVLWVLAPRNYKHLLIYGLLCSALGSVIFALSSLANSYYGILSGLFIIGFGFSYLQISINPLTLLSGNEENATSRLNLAQGFYSLATTLAPTIGVIIIYDYLKIHEQPAQLLYPYMMFAVIFVLLMLLVLRLLTINKIPTHNNLATTSASISNEHRFKLYGGMLAIFAAVGLENSIVSNFIHYATINFAVSNVIGGRLLALHWGGFMIGRFLTSISLSKANRLKKLLTMIMVATCLTILLVFINNIAINDSLYLFSYQIFIIIILSIIPANPRIILSVFAVLVAVSMFAVSILPSTKFLLMTLVASGLFNSLMFPTIFSLATKYFGDNKQYASSMLVMMIVGGALIPPLQGYIADHSTLNFSFIVPAVASMFVALYSIFYSMN